MALTGVNVYVFFFRDDTAVRKLMSTGKLLSKEKTRVLEESIPTAASPMPPAPAAASAAGKVVQGAALPAAVTAQNQAPATGAERSVEGKFGPSDVLGTVLVREGLGGVAGPVIRALSRLVDPKLIRPGDGYAVFFDDEGAAQTFEYIPSPVLRYVVAPRPDGTWFAKKQEKAIEVRATEAAGLIESSLYESVQKAGESSALVSLLVELFAWDLNFYIDTHPGDHWKVVVEKQFLGGQFYKYGHLLAAEYGGRAGTYRAFYWNPSGARGTGHYYDERGQAVAKAMLKTPLRYVRISSKFDLKRFHPILHRTKAHLGVDYAAPVGTPVWAPMTGRVTEAQMKSGSGNTVVLLHPNGLSTRYYHLARFAKGLKVGQTVQQKEVIGYVGTTGLSTGPHLHFSVTKNGGFIDPTKLQIVREAPVSDRQAYLAAVRPRLTAMKALPPTVAKND